MGDLLSILSNASQSLSATQGAATTAAHNIQNVNTPGYARQIATLETSLPGELYNGVYVGNGTRLASVTQARDRFLEAQVPYTFGQASFSKAKAGALNNVRVFDPDLPGGVGDALSKFFDSLRTLSQNPSNRALRDGTVNAAKSLEISIQRASRDLDSARTSLDSQVAGHVDEINRLSGQVASLNKQINLSRLTSGAEPNDMLDARQKAQDRLAELTGATPVRDAAGNVTLTLPRGGALVAGEQAGKLVTKANVDDLGHLQVLIQASDSSTPSTLPDGAISGELGGLLSARDGTLKTAGTKLDDLAAQFTTSMNAAHTAGVTPGGAAGGALFSVSPTGPGNRGAATTFALSITDSSLLATAKTGGGVGDNRGVQGLVALADTALASGSTPINAYAELTGAFGSETQAAAAAAEHDTTLRDHLEQMRDSVIGVSIDEEMVAMTKAQRAYEAISRVINTSNSMLDTLLKLGG